MSDQTPPERIAELEDRIKQLEATTKKMMPTRRDALKYGGAAAIGAAAMSGTASAGSSQVGTIGDNSNLVDLVAEDVTITDTLNTASLSGAAADEALTSDGAGGLTFQSVGGGVPPNFSYNDVSTSRSLNTTFTNNTGKALFVAVTVKNTSVTQGFNIFIVVNGSNLIRRIRDLDSGQYGDGYQDCVTFFVPDGADYRVGTFGSIVIEFWIEAQM